MPDLSPVEREAIQSVSTAWNRQPGTTDRADDVVMLVQRVLAAVPRLREIPGMGISAGLEWNVLNSRTQLLSAAMNRENAVTRATYNGPGHHAVRLAVVEVATPTEEKDDG